MAGSRLRFRCEKCSSEFRPQYHFEGEKCPLDGGAGGTGSGDGGAGEKQGEQQGEQQGNPVDADGLAEHMKQKAKGSVPPPPSSDSSIEDLIVKIARREAGVMDDAVIDAAAEAFGMVGEAVDKQFRSIMEQVEEVARNAATGAGAVPMTIEVKQPGKPTVEVKGQHRMFATVLKLAAARANFYLVGPAGSGKTVGVEKAAEALGLKFYPKSMGPTTTAYELLGYMDAAGNYVPGLLFEPFTNGGLLLLDEIDSASAAAVTTLNTALANDYCAFPHGVYRKHVDFVIGASGNTFGRGADRLYVGRTQLDAATLNRFFQVEWDYDEKFEEGLALGLAESYECDAVIDWLGYVHKVRRAIVKNGIRAVAGTRDIAEGAKALAAGFTIQEVADMRFFAAMSKDDKAKVLTAVAADTTEMKGAKK